MRTRRVLSAFLTLLAVSAVLNGCTQGTSRVVVPPTRSVESTYVAIGASDSVGYGADDPLREAWPQLWFLQALDLGTQFFNLAIPGSTVKSALTLQVPHAVRLEPEVVTVWLNVNDLIGGEPADSYEQLLGDLVRQLRRGGKTTVLVANTPPLERLPAYREYLACAERLARAGGRRRIEESPQVVQPSVQWSCSILPYLTKPLPEPDAVVAAVAAYNEAIGRVAAAEGAVLVDLHADAMDARSKGIEQTLVGRDGFHPSTEGHRRIAEAFRAALKSSKD